MHTLRAALGELVRTRWDGNVSAAARVIGVSQVALRNFLESNNDASVKTLRGCARLLPAEVAEAVGIPRRRRGVTHPNLDEAIGLLQGRYSDRTIEFARAMGGWFERDVPFESWVQLMRVYERAHAEHSATTGRTA